MASAGRNIIVIGTSAGGLEALDALIGQLPAGLPASIFIVQHIAPENTGDALLHRLGRHKAFACTLANDGEAFANGRIYIARANAHLLVKKSTMLVTKGARENRYRPGVDPLFRSAAVAHGPRVIGVILTGMLDDGTAGMIAVQKCGGVTVVQDPEDATYPAMPQNTLNNLTVDHCLPIAGMGDVLARLVVESPGKRRPVPADVRTEAKIAERVLSDVAQVEGLGDQVPHNCPNCGGVLWQVGTPDVLRFRCHTGHSYTATSLLASQNDKIEETIWVALRMFEERKNLLNAMARTEIPQKGESPYAERAKDADIHIQRIRTMLVSKKLL